MTNIDEIKKAFEENVKKGKYVITDNMLPIIPNEIPEANVWNLLERIEKLEDQQKDHYDKFDILTDDILEINAQMNSLSSIVEKIGNKLVEWERNI